MKIACAPEYHESATQGLRKPISGTALHTGRLPEPYRCAGRTRNRLTISYLTITAAQAFFQCTPTAMPKFEQLADRTIFQLPPLSISEVQATPWDTHQMLPAHHQRHPKPGDSPTALFPASATHHIGPATPPPAPLLDLQHGSDAGTTAGIYGFRRLKAKHCAEPVGEARRSAWPLPLRPTVLDIRHFLGSSHPTKCPGACKSSVAAALEICHRKNAAATGHPEFVRPVSAAGLAPESEASRCDRCFAES